jgi:hypothetical protein
MLITRLLLARIRGSPLRSKRSPLRSPITHILRFGGKSYEGLLRASTVMGTGALVYYSLDPELVHEYAVALGSLGLSGLVLLASLMRCPVPVLRPVLIYMGGDTFKTATMTATRVLAFLLFLQSSDFIFKIM